MQTTFCRLIWVRALFSSLMITAGPVTFSMRASLIQSCSGLPGTMETAVGTFLNWGRTSVSPACWSLMAATLCPRKCNRWREWASRERTSCNDAVLAAVEMEVFDLVADVLQSRPGRAEAEIHVGEIAVLGDMEADADGGGIAGADLDVDIAHRAVERAGAAVRRGAAARPRVRRRKTACTCRFPPGTGRVLGQGQDRPAVAVADQADAGPDVDGLREAVGPLRDEQDAGPGAGRDLVDGLLQGGGIVRNSVATDREVSGVR